MMSAVRTEYYTMVGLVGGNIPLLYVLNKDWFHTLIFETPGKIVLGICGIVIVVTYFFLMKFTKPVEAIKSVIPLTPKYKTLSEAL